MNIPLHKFYSRQPNTGGNMISTFIFGRLAAIYSCFDLHGSVKAPVKDTRSVPAGGVKKSI